MGFDLVKLTAAFLSLTSLAFADTCDDVASLTAIDVARPLSLSYIAEQDEYWSEACSLLKPSCIIFPTTADEVAAIMRILRKNNDDFSVKSGGHSPNLYFSSVEDGPIISTVKLDSMNLDEETGIVQAGPGNRLDDMAKQLDGTGWTFVGGRIGNTGIGGLILGGGLSYMSTQYGWSASSVIEYEVVLADGRIVTASEDENNDLFKALKGGGNNFGVVTTYTLQTYRQGDVWGGNLAFLRTSATDKKLLAAVRDFTEYNTDEKAAVIVTAERGNVDLVDSWILFLFYDGPDPPADTFKNFTDVGPVLNTCKTQTYNKLIGGSNWVIVPASTVLMGTETIPIPAKANSSAVFDSLHSFWREVSTTTLLVPGIVASIAYQPFQKAIAKAARARGYDLIDAEEDADKLIIEINYSFLPVTPRDKMLDVLEKTYTGYRERVLGWQKDGTMPKDVYLPLFMNYGNERQDYWSRLKASSRKLAHEVAQKYDPEGVFLSRTGGWKP